MAVEPVSFAQNELNAIRNEVNQAFQSTPPNFDQCVRKQSLVIAVYLRFIKKKFDWICNTVPSRSTLTCSSWA